MHGLCPPHHVQFDRPCEYIPWGHLVDHTARSSLQQECPVLVQPHLCTTGSLTLHCKTGRMLSCALSASVSPVHTRKCQNVPSPLVSNYKPNNIFNPNDCTSQYSDIIHGLDSCRCKLRTIFKHNVTLFRSILLYKSTMAVLLHLSGKTKSSRFLSKPSLW